MNKIIYMITLISLLSPSFTFAQLGVNLETGVVFGGYNDVQIPRDSGTRFSLTDDLKTDSKQYYRVNLNFNLNDRDHFSLLIAPLSLNAGGVAPGNISYENEIFPAGSNLEAKYKFNSYRLTYRRTFVENDRFIIGLGLTGKIRDAAIEISDGAATAEKTNVGFVPLINFNIKAILNNKLSLILNGDALAAPQGRAEDVLVGLNYSANDLFETYFGYRILEGGADVDEVYNFALLHYLAFGLNVRL